LKAKTQPPKSSEQVVPPRHCSDDFDDKDGDWLRLETWLPAAAGSLRGANLGRLSLPHPRNGQGDISLPDVDPSTAWIFIAAGRRPKYSASDKWASEDVNDALYVGVVAQSLDASWQGLAGMYVFEGAASADRGGKQRLARIRSLLPDSTNWVDEWDLPFELQATANWFDRRLHGAQQLIWPELPGHWHTDELRRVPIPAGGAVLVRLGRTNAALHNLLLVERKSHLRELAIALLDNGFENPSRVVVSYRGGSTAELIRLAAGQETRISAQAVTRGWRRQDSTGWVVVAPSNPEGRVRLLSDLRSHVPSPLVHDNLWFAPRVSLDGATDWSALIRFTRQLAKQQSGPR
jgi:hypothetical protein